MKTLDEARKGWQEHNLAELRKLRPGNEQAPLPQGLRSVAWKECLLFETSDTTKWSQPLSESRSAYNALRQHFLHALQHPDELGSTIDPLTEDNESPWESLRRDEAVRAEIFQDVERCMPENVYFRQPATQGMLLDILFIFSKLNPDVGYRQGMHELVAPVVWVVERDALDPKHWQRTDIEDTRDDKLLADLLDQRYIEHDAFTIFCLIMQNAKAFYEPGSRTVPKLSTAQTSTNDEAPILARINRIYGRLLPQYDPELSAHLIKLDVVPQVFLMRWMRLLFGREFTFDDSLTIWDQLFASDPSLDLVDFICAAMILRLRWKLLEADATEVLRLMLHNSEGLDSPSPNDLVLDALELRQDRTAAAGAKVIKARTGRTVSVATGVPGTARPVTPPGAFPPTMGSPNRAPSPFRSPSRFPTPINPVTGLEGLLTDAARAAYSRGEKWGLSRAVRGAVGDVRKNLAAFNASPRSNSHQRIPSNDVLQRVSQLESRNKALASMLEGALAELWECQRHQVERLDQAPTAADKDATDALGVAIAKVQFVQVYLNDQSLPLPVDEPGFKDATTSTKQSAQSAEQQGTRNDTPTSIDATLAEAIQSPSLPDKSNVVSDHDEAKADPRAPNENAPRASTDQPRQSQLAETKAASKSDNPQQNAIVSASPPSDIPSGSPSRPSLEQSSFSWMLGHHSADRQHAFASASPFTDETHLPSRSRTTGKGFLFGVGDEDGDAGTEERSRRGSQEDGKKGRKRVGVLRKKGITSSRGGKEETAPDGRNSAGTERGSEDIDLNAL